MFTVLYKSVEDVSTMLLLFPSIVPSVCLYHCLQGTALSYLCSSEMACHEELILL